jgi:hypothetical protein
MIEEARRSGGTSSVFSRDGSRRAGDHEERATQEMKHFGMDLDLMRKKPQWRKSGILFRRDIVEHGDDAEESSEA